MINQIDGRLREWVSGLLPDAALSFAPPGDEQSGQGVSAYLLDLLPAPPLGGGSRLPLQLYLRYLLTTWAETPEQAHQLLGTLVLAAMEQPAFDVELDPLPPEAWSAFRVTPRPSFMLRVPLRVERVAPPVKIVRQPLHIEAIAITALVGRIVTPDDVPLSGARVELPALHLSTHTDAQGAFRFPSVPADPRQLLLVVRAKGQEQQFPLDEPLQDQKPLLIRFAFKEA